METDTCIAASIYLFGVSRFPRNKVNIKTFDPNSYVIWENCHFLPGRKAIFQNNWLIALLSKSLSYLVPQL